MTGFCTTIDLISKRICELLHQDYQACSEIPSLAQRIAGEFDITLGTATWIVRNVVRNYRAQKSPYKPSEVTPALQLAEV